MASLLQEGQAEAVRSWMSFDSEDEGEAPTMFLKPQTLNPGPLGAGRGSLGRVIPVPAQ